MYTYMYITQDIITNLNLNWNDSLRDDLHPLKIKIRMLQTVGEKTWHIITNYKKNYQHTNK